MLKDVGLIFITGASRSGTTMVNRILGNNTKILALKELHYFGDLWNLRRDDRQKIDKDSLEKLAAQLLARANRGIWGGKPQTSESEWAKYVVNSLGNNDLNGAGLFKAVLAELASKAERSIVSEQTPRNIFYAKQILALYPNSKVIHLIRDPRAVLASQKNRWRRKWLGAGNVPWKEALRVRVNYHPITMGKLWTRATEVALSLQEHPRVRLIKFEDLVLEPEKCIKGICEFLRIEYEASMCDVPQVGSSNQHCEEKKLGMRKEVLQAWQDSLTVVEISLCERITRDLMDIFGYKKTTRQIRLTKLLVYQIFLYPLHLFALIVVNPKRTIIQLKALLHRYAK